MGLSTTHAQEVIIGYLTFIFARNKETLYPGERLTVSQHMLQCATLAEAQGESDLVIVAALLHDVGHLIEKSDQLPGVLKESAQSKISHLHELGHEDAGAILLEGYFPQAVIDSIRLHVEAKRYLCTVESDYIGRLSPASASTLSGQGGLMSESELQQFEKIPHLETVLKVRRLDDIANDAGYRNQAFSKYCSALRHTML